MNKKKFPLGFWNYAYLDIIGDTPVKDWIECGMNLCLSPTFRPGKDKPEDMVSLLDECQEKGVQLIIADQRCGWTGASTDPEAYKARVSELLEEYGRHPAVYGYYVGDEPSAEQMADAIAAIQILKELSPGKVPFINFLGYWDGVEEEYLGGMDFDEWIDDFIKKTGLNQISYDVYTQMNPPDAVESGINQYFLSLNRMMAAGKRNGVPVWVTNLSVGHFRYRCPNEDDFRWQLNTSVASGAKCVWWFFFYMRLCRVNYRVAPIDEHNERTETYAWLSRVQRSFQKQFGALFAQLEHEETYHCGHAYGGYPLLERKSHPLLNEVTCDHKLPSMVSFFHLEDGTKYMAIVNTSQTESGRFHCYFKPKVKELYRVCYTGQDTASNSSFYENKKYHDMEMEWGGIEVNCAKNDVCNNYKVDENGMIHNASWLAPGQMDVFRLVIED